MATSRRMFDNSDTAQRQREARDLTFDTVMDVLEESGYLPLHAADKLATEIIQRIKKEERKAARVPKLR